MYAIGEGAGMAGGIVSSAVDGLKIADKIIFAKLMLDSNCNPVSTIENLLMGILEVKYYAKGS